LIIESNARGERRLAVKKASLMNQKKGILK